MQVHTIKNYQFHHHIDLFELLYSTLEYQFYADNKIYTTIASENKEKIEIFKLHKKNDNYTLATNLFDKDFKRIHQNRQQLSYDERRDTYTNFLVDNEGNFVFTKETKEGNR